MISGAFFESWVFSEIYRSYLNDGMQATRHFPVLNPVAESIPEMDFSSLKMEISEGAVVCLADELLPIDAKNWCVPAGLI